MLPVGYILKEKYRILGHIASGGFGNTYLAVTLANNVKVAVKEFFMKNINAYDNSIRYTDHVLGGIVDELKQQFQRAGQQ